MTEYALIRYTEGEISWHLNPVQNQKLNLQENLTNVGVTTKALQETNVV